MRLRSEVLLLLVLPFIGCQEDPVPKPRAYFRIDLPQKEYVQWQDTSPIAAEIPAYAQMARRPAEGDIRWYDLRFKDQKATLHLTWTPIRRSVMDLIEDAHIFKSTHEAKAAKISSARVMRDSTRVFGNIFHVEGDVASPVVFYLTDSTDNFLYGSLYFDVRPNGDSLAPVTERIRDDVRHFAETLEWK